jgi:hypothetical protein
MDAVTLLKCLIVAPIGCGQALAQGHNYFTSPVVNGEAGSPAPLAKFGSAS